MEFTVLVLLLVAPCVRALASPRDSCGQRFLVAPPGMARIVGGRKAPEGAWPWQVSIQIQSRHHCGGTIVSSLSVLTAAHCFHGFLWIRRSYFRVVAGLNVLSAPGPHTQIRSIREVHIHKDYRTSTGDNDVALVMLFFPFNFSRHIQPVCTPHNATHEFSLNFSHCFISGWGKSWSRGKLENRLQEAEVELIDRRTCNLRSWYGGIITKNMLCAGLESGASDTCQGDSGGPLQCHSEDEDRFYVVGVTSFGIGCGIRRKPGVYARTGVFAGWLNQSQTGSVSAAHRPRSRRSSAQLSAALMLLWNVHK